MSFTNNTTGGGPLEEQLKKIQASENYNAGSGTSNSTNTIPFTNTLTTESLQEKVNQIQAQRTATSLGSKYTGSPLGIIDSFVGPYDSGDKKSIFSAYSDGVNKHTLLSYNGGKANAILSDKPHSSDIYDISTSNIIDELKGIDHLKLDYPDFAYLKNFGVFPNNRLIIARRYPKPVVDDLFIEKQLSKPLSTVIGYIAETENFLSLSFNEEWEPADPSFKKLLNDLGGDFGMKTFQLGDILEGAMGVIPLPGASLLAQRKLMAALGIFGDGITTDDDGNFVKIVDGKSVEQKIPGIPQGDPNLIKQAMNRSLIEEDGKGSGLVCKVNVTIKTIYEQKFINGVDPTIAFMDIINNLLNMGTSPATFYLGKQTGAKEYFEKFIDNPFKAIKEFIEALIKTFKSTIVSLDKAISDSKKKVEEKGVVDSVVDGVVSVVKKITGGEQKKEEKTTGIGELISEQVKKTQKYVEEFINLKYKVKFMGIVNALTGGASTPWHVTVGNPLRPIFCSGDMLCTKVDVKLGPQLSFNDLPTFIEVEVTLTSARNIGLQEIFSKMNSGGIRTTTMAGESGLLVSAKSYWNSDGEITQPPISSNATDNTPSNKSEGPSDAEKKENVVDGDKTLVVVGQQGDTNTTNPDPYGESVVPSGTNNESDEIKRNATYDSAGTIEGNPSKVDEKNASENSGVDADITDSDSAVPKKWVQGHLESSKSISVNGVDYKIRIFKSETVGIYTGTVEDDKTSIQYEGTSVNDLISEIIGDL